MKNFIFLFVVFLHLQINALPTIEIENFQNSDCGAKEHLCASEGRCINEEWMCDGNYDCEDKSDEEGCDNHSVVPNDIAPNDTISFAPLCNTGEFLCLSDSLCINKALICDGNDDCSDKSDEEDCGKMDVTDVQHEVPSTEITVGDIILTDLDNLTYNNSSNDYEEESTVLSTYLTLNNSSDPVITGTFDINNHSLEMKYNTLEYLPLLSKETELKLETMELLDIHSSNENELNPPALNETLESNSITNNTEDTNNFTTSEIQSLKDIFNVVINQTEFMEDDNATLTDNDSEPMLPSGVVEEVELVMHLNNSDDTQEISSSSEEFDALILANDNDNDITINDTSSYDNSELIEEIRTLENETLENGTLENKTPIDVDSTTDEVADTIDDVTLFTTINDSVEDIVTLEKETTIDVVSTTDEVADTIYDVTLFTTVNDSVEVNVSTSTISSTSTSTPTTTAVRYCREDEFFCDTTCIPLEWKCDGAPDCWDNTDEENCIEAICPYPLIPCPGTGQCIYKWWRCDGRQDCSDGSDEYNCV